MRAIVVGCFAAAIMPTRDASAADFVSVYSDIARSKCASSGEADVAARVVGPNTELVRDAIDRSR